MTIIYYKIMPFLLFCLYCNDRLEVSTFFKLTFLHSTYHGTMIGDRLVLIH